MNLRAFARFIAERTGSNPDTVRRSLYRWLAGHGPEWESATSLGSALDRPAEDFYNPRVTRRPADEEDELRALIAQVADDRVAAQAETRDDLALLRQVLEQLAQRVSLLEARLTESRGLGTQ